MQNKTLKFKCSFPSTTTMTSVFKDCVHFLFATIIEFGLHFFRGQWIFETCSLILLTHMYPNFVSRPSKILSLINVRCLFTVMYDYCPSLQMISSSVARGCKIHQLHLCRQVRPPNPNKYPIYGTKQSDGEATIMLELWGMQNTSYCQVHSDPEW